MFQTTTINIQNFSEGRERVLGSIIPVKTSRKNPAVAQRPSATPSKNLGDCDLYCLIDSCVIKVINPLLMHVLNFTVNLFIDIIFN